MPDLLRFWFVAAVALAGCGFSEATLQCQRAGAHLAACCPGFAIQMLSCGQLNEDTSQCVLASSCETLTDHGFCDAAQIEHLRESLCP